MTKAEVLAKKKWLKNRRRENKIKKQHNYETKTHKGTSRDTLRLVNQEKKRAIQKDIALENKLKKQFGLR
jgi:hypothetical protein